MRIQYLLIMCAAGSVYTTNAAFAADLDFWPGWLGPRRDGFVQSFQSPQKWPTAIKQQWQREVGAGYGSPLVADGRVYQHARQGANEVVWSLDLKSGEVQWRAEYAAPFKVGGGGEYHGKGPKSCPVLHDGRLYTMSISGTLTAWDTESGQRIWRRNYDMAFKKSHPYWGASTSPLVDGKRVFVHFGTDDEGALVALDTKSGRELWRQGPDGPSYSSPLLAEFDGVRQVVEWNHRALVGVDVQSGKKLWEYPFPHVGSDQNMPTPSVHGGRVYIGGENRGLHCVQPVFDDEEWSVREIWHQDKVALDMSSAVVNNGRLFGFSHYGRGRLFAVDMKDGQIVWQGPGRTGRNVMFLSVPNFVLALIDDGRIQVVDTRADKFEQVAVYRVADGHTWAPPVLLRDGLLVKDLKTLTRWSFK